MSARILSVVRMRCYRDNTLSSDRIIAAVIKDEDIRIVMNGSEVYGFVNQELNEYIKSTVMNKEVCL